MHRSPVYAAGGIVATTQPLASAAGAEILRRGGNAIDAAVAAAGVLAVTEPMSCGLGGDGFALVYDGDGGAVHGINGSGRAPAALSIDRVRADGFAGALPVTHAHTVTVPGAVSCFCALQERFGKLPLADAWARAVELADGGFPVAPITAYWWEVGANMLLRGSPGGGQLLLDGRAPRAGELIRNRALADVLRAIAAGGARAFYAGWPAERIAGAVRRAGGVMTTDDLHAHEAEWVEPIATSFGDARIWECPPNGQGLTALLALDLIAARGVPDDPVDRAHLVIEALRLAFADARRYIADPAHARVPVAALLDPAYAAARAELIDMARANPDPAHGRPLASSDTVYLSAVDGDGTACSLIFSNYMGFGTGIVPDELGFPLQNRGANFSLDPAHPNALAPGKRPYHTIIPALATRVADGSLYASFGVMGGFMQPQGHVQVALALLCDGDDPQTALDRPRLCIQDRGVALEDGTPTVVVEGLRARGHDVRVVTGHARALFGRGQVITRDPATGVLCGGSDPRGDGCAVVV